MLGQRSALRSAIENVLRNALTYSPQDSPVLIELGHADSWVSITVTDQGPGVPEQDLKRIFEPLFRVGDSRDRGSGGEGIGLAITERVARMHDGNVSARNRPGGGLVVRIELPAT